MVKISNAELEVMKVVWEKKEVSSWEIISQLKSCNWKDNTIRTLINRLIAKKAIGISKKTGKTYSYVALIRKELYCLKRTKEFARQMYDGSIIEMILDFLEEDEVSKEELEKMIKIVKAKI